MHQLSVNELLKLLRDAIKFNLKTDFIMLISEELNNRLITNIDNNK
jgi:hypothetical protein